MNKFGVQFLDEHFKEKLHTKYEITEKHKDIKDLLHKFQIGYTERNVEKVNMFMEELFINGENTYVLGTGTGELFLGSEQVKKLISDDWEYWGDVSIDFENAHISTEGEVAWFATSGTVKYSFEDTPERYDNYVNFIKNKVEETELTPKQKITFINWVLALTYHQRLEKKREYLWQLCLSGVLLKDADKWKIAHLQFSIPKANFPDERFESSKEYLENYNKQNIMVNQYKNNQITVELKELLKSLETEFVGQKDIPNKVLSKYFAVDRLPYIIGTENQIYFGAEQISNFFALSSASTLKLDLEHAIATKSGDITWVTVTGTVKQNMTEEELAKGALEEINNLFQAELTSKEKLFAAHRSIAYVLKESALGTSYTCPLRLTTVILNGGEGMKFHHIHISYPSYWIFEGKLDGIPKENIRKR